VACSGRSSTWDRRVEVDLWTDEIWEQCRGLGGWRGLARCATTSQVGLQGPYNFHVIDTPGTATKFSRFQGGVF
jgi:hypothetical protein